MKIIKKTGSDWLEKIGYSKKILVSENDINKKGFLIQEIKIKAGETATEHFHKNQTEIFYFLSNNGYWIINGKENKFNEGEILIIEPMDKHAVVANKDKDYIYLAIKFDYDQDDIYYEI